jgi:colanic acid/amylovoran biosynthesis protein
MQRGPNLCLFGASTDTGNLGVSALSLAVLACISSRCDGSAVTVFDEGWGKRTELLQLGRNQLTITRVGARYSKRFYRPESMCNIRLSCMFGGLRNPAARAILDADAILDISGGDSFADLYGQRRFRAVTIPKLIALAKRIPLILLPQTFGPFQSPESRRVAVKIVRRATMAWARDEQSYAVLRDLAGDEFDAVRHRCGVDVAFALEAQMPSEILQPRLREWLLRRDLPIAGINVSGLLVNNAAVAGTFGITGNYREIIVGLVKRLLRETDARVVLVPHVITPAGHYESDIQACDEVAAHFGAEGRDRIALCPAFDDPRHAKWVISQMDWFCGTRMHSTVASLSSGVPTTGLAYSGKFRGVFETCGQAESVVDLRTAATGDAVEALFELWRRRERTRDEMQAPVAAVLQRAETQMDEIMSACSSPASAHAAGTAAAAAAAAAAG